MTPLNPLQDEIEKLLEAVMPDPVFEGHITKCVDELLALIESEKRKAVEEVVAALERYAKASGGIILKHDRDEVIASMFPTPNDQGL